MLFSQLPNASDSDRFRDEPIHFLAQARAKHGDLFLIRQGEALFSRIKACPGVLAAFGFDNQRTILSDIRSYSSPVSAMKEMHLSQVLVNLNRSLHSMKGLEHASQRRLLMELFNRSSMEMHRKILWETIEEAVQHWTVGTVGLVEQMRKLISRILGRLLFGDLTPELSHLPSSLRTYFELRREITSSFGGASQEDHNRLTSIGTELDRDLRQFIRNCRASEDSMFQGVLAKLAAMNGGSAHMLHEDDIVGHINILFISSTEPLPVALAWFFLVLSQLPLLREALKSEITRVMAHSADHTDSQLNEMVLLGQVVNETLRLLTPNAFMTRITTRETTLNGIRIPPQCEILLSPFLSHRDPSVFHKPNTFLPQRWAESSPSPFVYFPFGAGGHSCIGRTFALDVMKSVAAFLIPRFDFLLANDQEIDWSVKIFFAPEPDPRVFRRRAGRPNVHQGGGMLRGPVRDLLDLEALQAIDPRADV